MISQSYATTATFHLLFFFCHWHKQFCSTLPAIFHFLLPFAADRCSCTNILSAKLKVCAWLGTHITHNVASQRHWGEAVGRKVSLYDLTSQNERRYFSSLLKLERVKYRDGSVARLKTEKNLSHTFKQTGIQYTPLKHSYQGDTPRFISWGGSSVLWNSRTEGILWVSAID